MNTRTCHQCSQPLTRGILCPRCLAGIFVRDSLATFHSEPARASEFLSECRRYSSATDYLESLPEDRECPLLRKLLRSIAGAVKGLVGASQSTSSWLLAIDQAEREIAARHSPTI